MSPSTLDSAPTPIILTGGLGTRLRPVTGATPKVLAEIQGQPFILYLLKQLRLANFERTVISIGYGADEIVDALGYEFEGMKLEYCREDTPLGTGGAIRLALEQVARGPILAMNGDSIVNTSLTPFVQAAMKTPEAPSLLAVKIPDISRFGALEIKNGMVTRFCEKGRDGEGWINAGIYYFPRFVIESLFLGEVASLETDVLEKQSGKMRAVLCESEFIDIGTPESYSTVQSFTWMRSWS